MASIDRNDVVILRLQANGTWRFDRINVPLAGAATVAESGTNATKDGALADAQDADPTNTVFETLFIPAHAYA